MSNKSNTSHKDNTILGYLKRIITWQSASFAAAIIMPIAIYYCQKTDNTPQSLNKIELMRDSIKSETSIIEKTFNPDMIEINNDNIPPNAILEIKDFQLLSLELVTYWNLIETSPSILSFKHRKINEVSDIIDNHFSMVNSYMSALEEILYTMAILNDEGLILNNDNYKLNIAMLDKFNVLYQDYLGKLEKYKKQIAELRKQCKPEALADSTAEKHPVFFKTMNIANDMYRNEEYYRASLYFFKLIIAQNKKYNVAYNYYKNDPEGYNVNSKFSNDDTLQVNY